MENVDPNHPRLAADCSFALLHTQTESGICPTVSLPALNVNAVSSFPTRIRVIGRVRFVSQTSLSSCVIQSSPSTQLNSHPSESSYAGATQAQTPRRRASLLTCGTPSRVDALNCGRICSHRIAISTFRVTCSMSTEAQTPRETQSHTHPTQISTSVTSSTTNPLISWHAFASSARSVTASRGTSST